MNFCKTPTSIVWVMFMVYFCETVATKELIFYLPFYLKDSVKIKPSTQLQLYNRTLVYVEDNKLESVSAALETLSGNKEGTVHVLFMSADLSRMVSQYGGKVVSRNVWSVDISTCNVNLHDDTLQENCNLDYVNALHGLGKFFHYSNAAVIRTKNMCSQKLADKIVRLNAQNNSHRSYPQLTHYVISLENLSKDIYDAIYRIKVSGIDLIICLLPLHLTEIVLEMASWYELLDYSLVWLTIELKDRISHLQVKKLPWQWIDLKLSTNELKWDSIEQHILQIENSILSRNASYVNKSFHTESFKLNRTKCNNNLSSITIYARNSSSDSTLIWHDIGKWTPRGRMTVFPDANLLIRMIRRSTSLVTLKIVTIIDDPITSYAHHLYKPELGVCEQGLICRTSVKGYPDDHPSKWERNCCIGLAIDLITLVSRELHFTPDVYIVEDGFYGGFDKNASQWNGLVGDIQRHKADIAVAALTVTADRIKVVDFCEPFIQVDLEIMFSTIRESLSFINWEFLAPLSSELRIWILVTFIIGVYLIYILENQHLVLQRIIDKGVFPRYQWREGFSYFSGLTFQRDLGGKNPQRYGARVTAVSFAFGMVIIMTTYTAVLTASKVSESSSNPFFGFKDDRITNPTASFKYATVSHTSMESYFKNSKDEIHQRMYRFMLTYNVNQSLEGIEMVKQGKINAFIHETPFLTYHASKQSDCSLKIFGKPINQGGYAFSVPKDSMWKHLLSQTVLKLKDKEMIQEIYNKWFPAACSNNGTSTEYERVEINYFGGLIFILALFLVVSIALLGAEHFCYRHHRRVINPIQDKVQVWRESKAAERRNAIIDPEDISYLQRMHESGMIGFSSSKSSTHDSSSDDDISEGEEELIRMRLGRSNPTIMLDTRPSIASSIQRTSLDSLGQYYATNSVRRGSKVEYKGKKSSISPALHTTLELSEIGEHSQYDEDANSLQNSISSTTSSAIIPAVIYYDQSSNTANSSGETNKCKVHPTKENGEKKTINSEEFLENNLKKTQENAYVLDTNKDADPLPAQQESESNDHDIENDASKSSENNASSVSTLELEPESERPLQDNVPSITPKVNYESAQIEPEKRTHISASLESLKVESRTIIDVKPSSTETNKTECNGHAAHILRVSRDECKSKNKFSRLHRDLQMKAQVYDDPRKFKPDYVSVDLGEDSENDNDNDSSYFSANSIKNELSIPPNEVFDENVNYVHEFHGRKARRRTAFTSDV